MIYLAAGAVIVIIGVLLRIYYREEKDTMPKNILRRNMIGIVVLVLMIAYIIKTFVVHDDSGSEQNTEVTQ